MRDYLSPARRAMNDAIARVTSHKAVRTRQGILVTTGIASLFAVGVVALSVVRSSASDQPRSNSIVTTKEVTTSPSEAVAPSQDQTGQVAQTEGTQMTAQDTSGDQQSRSESKTKVTINNENIPVPENGTVNRTIQSDNGTTNVSVTVGSGTASNQSSTSTSTNVSTSTFSHSTTMNTSSQ